SRPRGAMRAIELVEDQASRRPLPAATVRAIVDDCVERGLVVIKAGIHDNVIRTLMPLTIPDADLERGLAILSDVLTMWDRHPRVLPGAGRDHETTDRREGVRGGRDRGGLARRLAGEPLRAGTERRPRRLPGAGGLPAVPHVDVAQRRRARVRGLATRAQRR